MPQRGRECEEKNIILDTKSKIIGFRSVDLVQEPLEQPDRHGTGTTFFFRINGNDVFMGGTYQLSLGVQSTIVVC